jgi:hypothetical protein
MKGDSQEFQMAAQPEGKTLLLLLPFFSIYSFFFFLFSPLSPSPAVRLLFLLSVEWREKIGRLTQPLACSKNQHTRKKKIIIRGFFFFFKKFFSFSYLSS